MTPESVMTLGRTAMEMTILVASPVLLVTLVVGLIVSVFQAATQINDPSLSSFPRSWRCSSPLPSPGRGC